MRVATYLELPIVLLGSYMKELVLLYSFTSASGLLLFCQKFSSSPALMAALDAGQVAAAGLDCFQTEPGGNLAFSVYDNIFMLPHIGSETNKRVAQWDF